MSPDTTTIVPVLLFSKEFPHWLAGIAFGAIVIGALVPAAIMAIAANTFARDIYKPYLRPNASLREEGLVSQITSVVLKARRSRRAHRA